MSSLESLDMSCSPFEVRIPTTFSKLTFLSFLNLLNNNLSGRIPNEKNFDAFDVVTFWGNLELCGSPLQRKCTDHDHYLEEGNDNKQTMCWWESWRDGFGFVCAIGFGSVTSTLALSRQLRIRSFNIGNRFMKYFSWKPVVYETKMITSF